MYRHLDAAYARIPDVGCKGLCHDQCTAIPAGRAEEYRLNQHRAGLGLSAIPFTERAVLAVTLRGHVEPCPMLTADKRCSVYAIRPFVCRIYGVDAGLTCPHGCMPEGGHMDRETAKEIGNEVLSVVLPSELVGKER